MSQAVQLEEKTAQPDAAPSARGADETPYPPTWYAWYCVFILLGIYMNSFLDRQILALLVRNIKEDLSLSDAEVGVLLGPAFAVFYVLAGLPLGWAADRMSRRLLVGVGQVFWTIASVCFGLGRNFGALSAARVGVGVGEASLSPAAYSLVADMFPPHRLATAMAIYSMGIYLGTGAAFLGGAYFVQWVYSPAFAELKATFGPFFADLKNWQFVFFLIALPTVPLTALLFTVREPARRGGKELASAKQLRDYLRDNKRTLICHNVGFALLSFCGYGAVAWTPTYMARIHHWEPGDFGKYFGWAIMVAGLLGIWSGGRLADVLRARGYRDAKMRVGLFAAIAWTPFGTAVPLLPDGGWAYAAMWPATFFSAFPWGVAPAAIQEIMPNRMRGQASAIYLFAVSLLGLAMGPYVLALMTTYVFRDDMMVHYSMLTTGAVANTLAIVFLARGLAPFRESVAYCERWVRERGG